MHVLRGSTIRATRGVLGELVRAQTSASKAPTPAILLSDSCPIVRAVTRRVAYFLRIQSRRAAAAAARGRQGPYRQSIPTAPWLQQLVTLGKQTPSRVVIQIVVLLSQAQTCVRRTTADAPTCVFPLPAESLVNVLPVSKSRKTAKRATPVSL